MLYLGQLGSRHVAAGIDRVVFDFQPRMLGFQRRQTRQLGLHTGQVGLLVGGLLGELGDHLLPLVLGTRQRRNLRVPGGQRGMGGRHLGSQPVTLRLQPVPAAG